MNVKELVFRGEDETKLYACGECGRAYSPKSYAALYNLAHEAAQSAAEKCCAPRYCKECGVGVENYRVLCRSCGELVRLRKATPIPERQWTDPVECEGVPGGWGDGFFRDIDDLLDACEVYEVPPPAYCWPCTARPLALNADSLLEHAVDDMHEDAMDEIVDADGVYEFVEAWNAKQTCKSWYPDMSRVVVLDQERFDALLKGGGPHG